jgi:N-acetylmuramic acid 6-phosphate etherase
LAALRKAKKMGAKTVFLCCNYPVKIPFKPNMVINPVTGPEVVAGSTRMKAGTATKLILNMITTTAMIRIGKTYGNLMVDLQATSEKLVQRSIGILMTVCDLNYDQAKKLLKDAKGHVKTAIAMHLLNEDYKTAKKRLQQADGLLSKSISKTI